jgi:hypothetical protein
MSGYIGSIPVPQATQTRQSFTATASQTTFNTAGYSPGYVDVFLNGVKLAPSDYTATNGSDIVLATGAAASDILEIVAYEIFQVADQDFTGDFSVDTDTLYVDSTNDRVGVGTSSPDAPLVVEESAVSQTAQGNDFAVFKRNADGYLKIYSGNTNVGGVAFGDPDDPFIGAVRYDHSSDNMNFYVNNAERMRIDSSGNVGIGTSSPSSYNSGGYRLVVGDGAGFEGMTIASGSAQSGNIYFADGTTGNETYRGHISYDHSDDHMHFKTAASERMRIDSSGNLLVGRTSTSDTNVGGMIRPDGFVQSTRDGNIAADFNRNTSDGDIVRFSKGSSPVGSIGSASSGTDLYISGSGTGSGVYFNVNGLLPMVGGNLSDNTEDLGQTGYRWKDLYLSGGVYLGGTGSANKLDDYEEGTWTPTNNGDATGTVAAAGRYTKIGRQVTIHGVISITAAFTGTTFGGLPFVPDQSTTISSVHGLCPVRTSSSSDHWLQFADGTTAFSILSNTYGTATSPLNTDIYRFSFTYQT